MKQSTETRILNTIDYYESNFERVSTRTMAEKIDDGWEEMLRLLKPGDRLLDAGCGPGRDVKYFLGKGIEVDAFDASKKMAELARVHTGIDVKCKDFSEVNEKEAYNAIWASASLLHVPYETHVTIYRKLRDALVQGGYWFASYKKGNADEVSEKSGRYFVAMDKGRLEEVLRDVGGLVLIKCWSSPDHREHRKSELWFKFILKKT